MQFFKGDDTEKKYFNSGEPFLSDLSFQKDEFFDDAYGCAILGELLYDSARSPLANAIDREIYRTSFSEIVDAFVEGGSFESYLTVFSKIFGEDVEVEFAVPAPGKLNIDITATGIELSQFVSRSIVDNSYSFDEMITQDGLDHLVFQTIIGFQSQYELEQMLFEMVPAGVFTTINLTLGE